VETSAFKWLQDRSGFYLTGQVVAAYNGRERFETGPYKGFRAPPQTGFRKSQLASACLREAASAEAGAFLSSLRKITFSANGPNSSFSHNAMD
jgi:hypothetical protein